MLKFEWKKLLFYRKGIWLLLAFLILSLLGTLLMTDPYDPYLEEMREPYRAGMEYLQGPLTPEKTTFIEEKMDALNQVHMDLDRVKTEYYSGSLSEEEYRQRYDELVEKDQYYEPFYRLFSQFIFVREDSTRSFVYTGGWETLLNREAPDYLLLLLLILLLTPVFCEEYSSQMMGMLLTQKRSAKHLVPVKIFMALFLTFCLVTFIQVKELLYCALRFGLPFWNVTLHSLPSFGMTSVRLTLWQAVLAQYGLRLLGYLYAAVIILFLSVLLKKFASVLISGVVLLPLPLLTFGKSTELLLLPGPWGFIQGTRYFHYLTNPLERESELLDYSGAPPETIGLLAGISGLLLVLMLLFVHRRNLNCHLKWHRLAAAACVLCLMLTGCVPSGAEAAPVWYNQSESSWYQGENFSVLDTPDGAKLVGKSDRAEFPLPPDSPQEAEHRPGITFYGEGDTLFYIKTTVVRPQTGNPDVVIPSYALMELNLSTFREKIRYQWNSDTSWFFGMLEKKAREPIIEAFFIRGNTMYYRLLDELRTLNLCTGQDQAYLREFTPSNMSYDGTYLYYTDKYGRLVSHNLDTGAEEISEEIVAETFIISPDGIYFTNIRDKKSTYLWSDGRLTKISDATPYRIYWDPDYLWLEFPQIIRCGHKGENPVEAELPGMIRGFNDAIYMKDPERGICYYADRHSLQILP